MKTYKHKTLWWIAKEKTNGDYRIYKQDKWLEKDIMDYVHCNLFVGSQDREEVVEQPPKRMRDVIEEYNKNYTHLNDHKLIHALEKHAPTVKKFKLDEVKDWYTKNYPRLIYNESTLPTLQFLQDHWLLEE